MQASVILTPYLRPALPSAGTFWLPSVSQYKQLYIDDNPCQRLTLVDVTLNHNTHNSILAGRNLLSKHSSDLRLVLVVLLGVTVAAVNHKTGTHALSSELSLSICDAGSIVVRALLATAKDNEAIRVTDSPDNGDNTGLSDGQEVVRVLDGANSVNSDIERAVGAVLESDGEGQTGGKLTVDLGLGGACTNSTDRQTVGQELGGDCVEHLAGNGHALVGQIDEQLARYAETLVDLEAVVDIGIVDQTLPADGCTWLFEVRAHHDQQIVGVLLLHLQ